MRRIELIKALGDEMLAAMRRIVQPINEKLAAIDGARETHLREQSALAMDLYKQSALVEKLQAELVVLRSAMLDIPAGQKGEKGDTGSPGPSGLPGERGERGEKGADGINGERGPQGERGEKGEPGPAGAAGLQGERGADGAPGQRGEKGDPGADGRSVTIEDVQPVLDSAIARAVLDLERRNADMVQRAVDLIPRPRDGIDGKDGRDAFDLADIVIEHDGERTLTVGFRRGTEEVVKTFHIPAQIDRGVYNIGNAYEKGDGVTYGGDYWIAVRSAAAGEKPGESDAWRLAVRKGRDGRRG